MAMDEEIDAATTALHHFPLHGRFPLHIPPSLQLDGAAMLEPTVGRCVPPCSSPPSYALDPRGFNLTVVPLMPRYSARYPDCAC